MPAATSSLLSVARLVSLISLLALASACTTLPSFSKANYVDPLEGAMVTENKTRYSEALECLRPMLGQQGKKARFAVGRVNDFSGKEDLTNGKRITQGAALMVISALSKSGVPLVERFDTTIADMELKYADNKLIGDAPESHRKIFAGSLPGSDYHVVGGITEVNYNIRSGSLDTSIRFFSSSARYFVMNVGIDLRLVNTKTLEVVNTQSLQKQIMGTELSGGYFRLFTDGLVDINAAERTQEPIQKGVRMVIEQAVFNMLSELNGIQGQTCLGNTLLPNQRGNVTLPTSVKSTKPFNADPNTGEIIKVEQNTPAITAVSTVSTPVGTSAATPQLVVSNREEAGNFKGLFGTVGAGPSTSTDEAAVNKSVMQEKLLYGARPVIR